MAFWPPDPWPSGHLTPGYPVIGQEAGFVHGAYVDHDEWAVADRPRVAHAVRLVDRAADRPHSPGPHRGSDRTVTVTRLHGLRDPSGKGDTPARRAQAERLAAPVQRTREPHDLVVVCGDLNLLPDSETFAVLAGFGLTDLVGTADTRTSRYLKPGRHANHLLVSDVAQVTSFEAPAAPEVSDHRPLELDV